MLFVHSTVKPHWISSLLLLNLLISSPTFASSVTTPMLVEPTLWQKLRGVPATTTLYGGMVTFHFNPNSRDDNWNNQLIALSMDGYFAGTLVNSYHDRAYAAGIQRIVYRQAITPTLNQSIGYRLGLISGYDKRMASIAEHVPLMPFPQVIYDLSWHHIGIEFSWCLVTASAGLLYQF